MSEIPWINPPAARMNSAVSVQQGACFRYAVPSGWQVMEDGQFAVTIMALDKRAITVMVGNAGLPIGYPPGQFIYEKLAGAGLQNPRLGQPRPAPPFAGCSQAWDFDVDYVFSGIPCRGVARCSVAPNYDFCTMVMTWAASHATQWGQYASWLPGVAAQVEVTHSAAFGASGIAQQNLQNSIMLGHQARRNREYSEQQWAEVVRQRGESQDRNNGQFRQAMGGTDRYYDHFHNRPIDLPAGNRVYWVHAFTGQIVGDPNPSFDPRTPIDASWQPMKPSR